MPYLNNFWDRKKPRLDCFENRKLAENIYTRPFSLADITVVDDNEIMQHRRVALLEIIQKHIRQRDMSELANKIANYYLMSAIPMNR